MKFTKLEAKPNLPEMQKEVLKFWQEDDTFNKSVNKQSIGEKVFYDGPPFPTGMPHHGTVLVSFIKDMIARYFTMKGYSVPRRWGWDCHGMPIENQVEEMLDVKGKDAIEKYGIGAFNDACYNRVSKNNNAWRDYVVNMGRWVDYDNSYKTMDVSYMESIMWTFKQIYDKGYIYKDYRVTPYCYRCETSLSISDTRESDSTRPRQDRWAIARFELDQQVLGKKAYMLAWTTTPWTLPSNMALAVGKNIDYAYVDMGEYIYIAGKNSLSNYQKVFGKEPNVVKVVKGSELTQFTYTPVTDYFKDKKKEGAFRVVCADYVTEGDGLSVVHIAPAFGEDDYWVGKKNNIPLVNPVDSKGRYTSEITDFASRNVMEANGDVIKFLYANGSLVADGTIEHNYPHCWRCKKPLIYKAMDSWYLSIERLKPKLLEQIKNVNFVPESVKDKRFGDWLNNARDWNLSRNRYFSTPIPIWECDKCGKRDCLGSIQEIKQKSGITVTDLHRQYLDKIVYPCSCGGEMKRISEVLDCWFESGSAPHARLHYPFENKEWFDNHSPSDFVVEYTGQIRCWFYYLHVLSVALFDKPAYKNCIVHGTVLADDGKKLSKSSKNYTDPMILMGKFGTDAFRLYMEQSKAMLLNDMRFDDNGISDQIKTIIIPLWNAVNFFISYAQIDGYEKDDKVEKGEFTLKSSNELDKWLLALVYDVEKTISRSMDAYEINKYVTQIKRIVDELTNWYIRRSRRRFYGSEMTDDKLDGYNTLFFTLATICKLIAPVAPFLAEKLYKSLGGDISVHLTPWVDVPKEFKADKLLEEVECVQKVIHLAHVIREQNKIKNRQPLSRAIVHTNSSDKKIVEKNKDIIAEEINVKAIDFVRDEASIASRVYKPNFSYIRENYASNMGEINRAIASGKFRLDGDVVHVSTSFGEMELDSEALIVEFKASGNMPTLAEGDTVVALDITLTDALVREGVAREVIRFVQDARKQIECELADRIKISFSDNMPNEFIDTVCAETLSSVQNFDKPDAELVVPTALGDIAVKLKK